MPTNSDHKSPFTASHVKLQITSTGCSSCEGCFTITKYQKNPLIRVTLSTGVMVDYSRLSLLQLTGRYELKMRHARLSRSCKLWQNIFLASHKRSRIYSSINLEPDKKTLTYCRLRCVSGDFTAPVLSIRKFFLSGDFVLWQPMFGVNLSNWMVWRCGSIERGREGTCTRTGHYLGRRFCKQFSESTPSLTGQQGRCRTTVELSEDILQNLLPK